MALNIHWKIPFKSLRTGTVYTINIWKDGSLPSGYPLILKGGADPFVTQEDDDDDMFAAVRTQSGYFRIFDDGHAVNSASTPATVTFDWHDILPQTDTDRMVTLTHVNNGSTIVDWQGYMQSRDFGSTLYGNPQEREFPIQCPLSALAASTVSGTQRELKNFAYVIREAFANLTGMTFTNFIFQGGMSARTWLTYLVDWQNLVNISAEGDVSGKYDNLQVMKDVCGFFGWTCRVYGKDVIFSRADDDDSTTSLSSLELTQAQLDSMADSGNTSAGTIGTFYSSVSLSGDIFASTNNEETLMRGSSIATVSANANGGDDTIIEAYPTRVDKLFREKWIAPASVNYDGTVIVYSQNLFAIDDAVLEGEAQDGYASFNQASGLDGNTSYIDVIRIWKSFTSTSATAYATLSSVFHHSFYDSVAGTTLGYNGKVGLILHGNVYVKGKKLQDYNDAGRGKKTMYMRVGVGKTRQTAQWWTGSAWSSTMSAFKVAIGNEDDVLRPLNGTTAYNHIPTNVDNMMGRLFVEFLGSDDTATFHNQRFIDISDFSIEFVRHTAQAQYIGNFRYYSDVDRADIRKYTASNVNKVRSDWNADLIYASDNDMSFGYGIILDRLGVQVETFPYYDSNIHPEQNLANRVATFWATPKRKIVAELRTNAIAEITPQNKLTMANTTFYPISINRTWHDDITTLTLIQL